MMSVAQAILLRNYPSSGAHGHRPVVDGDHHRADLRSHHRRLDHR